LVFLAIASRAAYLQESRGEAPEEQKAVRVEIREDEDDPAVWAVVNSFERSPSPKNTKAALKILDEMLKDWESHPAGVATTILQAIGEHRIEHGRKYLVRFLQIDPQLRSADTVASSAALALGDLGGRAALEELIDAAPRVSDDLASSIAVALGVLRDRHAIPTLESLAHRSDDELRGRALAALANYCSPTSKDLATQALAEDEIRVRSSAIWWLATCAAVEDAPYLVRPLRDRDDLIRSHALRGLTRLGSRIGCPSLPDLLRDSSLPVREAAEAYSPVCENR